MSFKQQKATEFSKEEDFKTTPSYPKKVMVWMFPTNKQKRLRCTPQCSNKINNPGLIFRSKLNLVLILTTMLPVAQLQTFTPLTTKDSNEPDHFLSLLYQKILSLEKELANIVGLSSQSSLTPVQEGKVRSRGKLSEEKKYCEEMAEFYKKTLEDNKEYFEARSNKDLQSLVTAMVMFAANNKDINIANRFQNTYIFNKYLFPGDLYKIWKRINQPTGETINSTIADVTDYLRKKMANPLYRKEVELFLKENGEKKFYNNTGHYYKAWSYSWQNVEDNNDNLDTFGNHFAYPNYKIVDQSQYQALKRYNERNGKPLFCNLPLSQEKINQYLIKGSQKDLKHEYLVGNRQPESVQPYQKLEIERPKLDVVQLLEGANLEKRHKIQIKKDEFLKDSRDNICREQQISSIKQSKQQQLTLKKKKQKNKDKKKRRKQAEPVAKEQLVFLGAHQTSNMVNTINKEFSNSGLKEEQKTQEPQRLEKEKIELELKEEEKQEISHPQPVNYKGHSFLAEEKKGEVSLNNLELDFDLKSEVSESTYQLASERTNDMKSDQEDMLNQNLAPNHLKKEETKSTSQSNLEKISKIKDKSSQKEKYFQNRDKKRQYSRQKKDQEYERSNQPKDQPSKKKYQAKYEAKEEIKERADSSSSSSVDIRLFRQEEIQQLEEEGFILVSKPKAKPQGANRGGNRSNRYRQLYQA